MSSPFYTTTNSIDEDSINEIELDSIRAQNSIVLKEQYLFDVYPKTFISQTKEIDEELLKIFPNNNSDEDNQDYQTNSDSNINSHRFRISKKKNRGKQTEKTKKSQHLSTDFDNLQRKIQVHYFTFIINLSNDALKAVLDSKTEFKQISYKLKILISHENVNRLHKSTIKDILKNPISPKNKNYPKSFNNDLLNFACNESKILERFFNIKYLDFFNDFYFNEEKETKNFYHLLKKYEKDKALLIDSAKSVYFYGYDTLVKNNSFVTFKKDIELKESDN